MCWGTWWPNLKICLYPNFSFSPSLHHFIHPFILMVVFFLANPVILQLLFIITGHKLTHSLLLCISTASEKHDDVTETEMPVGASGGIYPLLDPQSKSEVETGPVVTPPSRNQFVARLTGSNRGDVNSVYPGAVVEGESKLEEKKDPGRPYCRKLRSSEIYPLK